MRLAPAAAGRQVPPDSGGEPHPPPGALLQEEQEAAAQLEVSGRSAGWLRKELEHVLTVEMGTLQPSSALACHAPVPYSRRPSFVPALPQVRVRHRLRPGAGLSTAGGALQARSSRKQASSRRFPLSSLPVYLQRLVREAQRSGHLKTQATAAVDPGLRGTVWHRSMCPQAVVRCPRPGWCGWLPTVGAMQCRRRPQRLVLAHTCVMTRACSTSFWGVCGECGESSGLLQQQTWF